MLDWTILRFLLLGSALAVIKCAPTRNEYLKLRENVLQKENSSKTGDKVVLNSAEQKVNAFLMQLKAKEYTMARAPNGVFPPKMHFFHAKEYIDKSPIFDIIKKCQKVSVLKNELFATCICAAQFPGWRSSATAPGSLAIGRLRSHQAMAVQEPGNTAEQ